MIYFTSDLHFGHDKDFIYSPRGFKSVYEMNETLVKNWNEVVEHGDTVYVLGDSLMGVSEKNISYMHQLKGDIKIILGNHDSAPRIELYKNSYNMEVLGYSTPLKIGKQMFFISHYPTLCANDSKKIVNLCGHLHTKNKFLQIKDGIYHVEVDAHGCYPISIESIRKDLRYKDEF